MKAAPVIAVVVLSMAAAWLWVRDGPAPSATPGGSFSEVTRPREPVPMPDASVAVPAETSPGSASSETGTIRFPDGDEVEIRWRDPERLSFEITGNATTDYIPLRLAAEAGDGLAAFTLAMNLEACRESYRDGPSLEAAIDKLQQTGMLDLPALDEDIEISSSGAVPSYVDELTRRYDSCKGISDRQIAESDRLIGIAVEAGNPMSMMEYGRRLNNDVAAREFYERAWQGGQMHALLYLAEGFRAGYDGGMDPVDKLRWYAAYFLHGQLSGAPHNAMLEEVRRELLPHEIDEALDIAKEMLRSNPNCCERM